MKKADVMTFAKKLAALQEEARYNGMINMALTTEERVEQMARASLLQKQIDSAQKAYDQAFQKWESAGFPE